jgi:hypothetical protein
VWVFDGGRLHRVPVQVGLTDGTQTEITGDLAPGARVATAVTSNTASSPAPTTRSPLLPAARRGNGGGRS